MLSPAHANLKNQGGYVAAQKIELNHVRANVCSIFMSGKAILKICLYLCVLFVSLPIFIIILVTFIFF